MQNFHYYNIIVKPITYFIIIIITAFIIPNSAFANHTTNHSIQQIQEQISKLKTEIKTLFDVRGLIFTGLSTNTSASAAALGLIPLSTSSSITPSALIFNNLIDDEDVINHNIGIGTRGKDVLALQNILKERGVYNSPTTSYFGPLTQTAVLKYQQQSNLPATGFVGPLTRNSLRETRVFFRFGYRGVPETFIIKITDAQKIAHARDILAGKIADITHVMGIIVKEPKKYNLPWNYHLKPLSIDFFEIAPEICDAGIQYVENNLAEVGGMLLPGNQWCPWGSYLIEEIKQSGQSIIAVSDFSNTASSGEESIIEGQTEIVHFDNFQRVTTSDNYFLNTADGKQFTLQFTGEELPQIRSGERIRVRGKKQANQLIINQDKEGSVEPLNAQISSALRSAVTKKVAVVLLNFQNNPTQPFTIDKARTTVFTGASSVNSYYQETSFNTFVLRGTLNADGDIFGWYTVPYNNESCQDGLWKIAAQNAAIADGFLESNYTNIIFAWPYTNSCLWEGSSNLGGSYVYINGSFELKVIAHELGHNFTLHHANSYDCINADGKRVPISNTCTANEYGDPFDMMDGNPFRSTNHFNVFNKGRLNWFNIQNTQDVNQGGIYTIVPLEKISNETQVLRIPRTINKTGKIIDYYYLEFRQPFGFDNFNPNDPVVNGVSIRIAPNYNKKIAKTLLIDTTADTPTFLDAALNLGKIFQDKKNNLTIKTIAVTSSSITMDINITK